jgi:hypothetical protein
MSTFRFIDAGTYCLQQTVSGTGVFSGVRLGYAVYSYNMGGAQFDVRFPHIGTDGNAYKFQMDAPPNGVVVPNTTAVFDKSSKTLRVQLRGSTGAIASTAQEVVDAINGMERPIYGAALVANAVIPAGLAPVSLVGGLDPDLSAGYAFPKLTPLANTNGGLFYFDQNRPWKIQTVGGSFVSDTSFKVSIVNVDKALRVIGTAAVVLTSQNLTSPWQPTGTRIDVPIMPGQAVQVTANTQGTVFVTATPFTSMNSFSS